MKARVKGLYRLRFQNVAIGLINGVTALTGFAHIRECEKSCWDNKLADLHV